MPKGKQSKEDVRRHLLEAAAQQFAAKGLDATNIDDVAVSAGYGKGTVYNYFESKEHLFAEVLTEGCRRAVDRAKAVGEAGTTPERLRALAAADVAVLREEEGFMRVVVREAMSFRPRTYPLIVEHLGPYVGAVAEALLSGRERGEIRDDLSSAELAISFVGILTLLYVQHWGTSGAWPTLEALPDLAVTLFLDGAARRPHPPGEGEAS